MRGQPFRKIGHTVKCREGKGHLRDHLRAQWLVANDFWKILESSLKLSFDGNAWYFTEETVKKSIVFLM